MSLTLCSADYIIAAVLPHMLREHNGHIINVGDVSGQLPTPSFAAPGAATRALQNYTESIALSLADENIKVTFVAAAIEVTLATNTLIFTPPKEVYQSSIAGESRRLMENIGVFPEESFNDCVTAIMDIAGHKNPPHTMVAGILPGIQLKEKMNSLSNDLAHFDGNLDA
jgi:short-subunit dehydrogenase